METKKLTYKDVLTQREYLKIMLAALINRFGDSVDAIASTWIVYQLTSSAAWSAIVFAVNYLPTVLVTPFAGVFVEGCNKKKVMVLTDIIRGVVVACVATLLLTGNLQAWMLIISNILISTAEAFRSPASTAMTPMVLESKYYELGMSLSNSLSQIVQMVALGLGAGIIAFVGSAGALYIDMITFVLSALIIQFVNTNEEKHAKEKFNGKSYIANFKEGLNYCAGDAFILSILLYTVFLNAILVPINSLETPFVKEVMNAGVEAVSIINIAFSMGILFGALIFPKVNAKIKDKRLLLLIGVGITAYYIMIILAEPLYENILVAWVVTALLSIMMGVVVGLGQCLMSVLFVKRIDKRYIARTAGIFSSVPVAAMPVTSFAISAIVVFTGVKIIYLAAGVVALVVVVLFSRNHALDDEKTGIEQVPEEMAMGTE